MRIGIFTLAVVLMLADSATEAMQTSQIQVAPRVNASAMRQVTRVPNPANDDAATSATIDSRLSRFAVANAGNPESQNALNRAAAEVRQDPAAFITADDSLKPQAMTEMLGRHFDSVGPVTVPSAALDDRGTYATLGNMGDGDIMAIAFIVMMQAAKSAQEDLKGVMEGVKAINNQKKHLRDSAGNLDRLAMDCSRDPRSCNGTAIDLAVLRIDENAQVTTQDIDNAKETVKNKLDSLSEMGEMESLRLQMAMDRLSKLMSTLSNLLKKESDTASGIIQNIK